VSHSCRRLLGRRVVKVHHVDTSTQVLEYSKLLLHTNMGLDFLLQRPIGPSATICQYRAFGTSTAGQHRLRLLRSLQHWVQFRYTAQRFASSPCRIAAVDSWGGGWSKSSRRYVDASTRGASSASTVGNVLALDVRASEAVSYTVPGVFQRVLFLLCRRRFLQSSRLFI